MCNQRRCQRPTLLRRADTEKFASRPAAVQPRRSGTHASQGWNLYSRPNRCAAVWGLLVHLVVVACAGSNPHGFLWSGLVALLWPPRMQLGSLILRSEDLPSPDLPQTSLPLSSPGCPGWPCLPGSSPRKGALAGREGAGLARRWEFDSPTGPVLVHTFGRSGAYYRLQAEEAWHPQQLRQPRHVQGGARPAHCVFEPTKRAPCRHHGQHWALHAAWR